VAARRRGHTERTRQHRRNDARQRCFGYLTDQLLRRGVHKSVQTLEKDVREWIKTWNEDPKPFVWTKTAEEIPNSLARYISRISGAPH
jgi:hypothetical protein